MRYYTTYELDVYDNKDKQRVLHTFDYSSYYVEESILKDLVEIATFNPFLDSCTWYEHEDDMIALSKKHPDLLFNLRGEGESSGDIWHKWFHNGKKQICKGQIIFPSFDPEKLG